MPVGYHRNVSTASPGDPLGRIGPAGHSASSPSSGATPQLYKIAPEGENRKSNVGSSRLPLALARKHAEPYRLSSPRPPQCGALSATARSPSAAESSGASSYGDRGFESASLQQRVCELSVPEHDAINPCNNLLRQPQCGLLRLAATISLSISVEALGPQVRELSGEFGANLGNYSDRTRVPHGSPRINRCRRSSVLTFTGWYQMRERPLGSFWTGNRKEVRGAPYT